MKKTISKSSSAEQKTTSAERKSVQAEQKSTLTEQVLQDIGSKITSGYWKEGTRLPNERELAKLYNVARGRIREALRALAIVGLVVIRPGDGSYVRNLTETIPGDTILWMFHEDLHNFEDIYAARQLIETEVYMLCFRNRNDVILEKIREFEWKLFDISSSDVSTEEFGQMLDTIDHYIGLNCGNGVFTKLMQTMIFLRHATSLKVLELPEAKEHAVYHRHRVLHSFSQNDEEVLRKELKALFDSAKGI